MWIFTEGLNGYNIGYYRPTGSFQTMIRLDGKSIESLNRACVLVNFLNGGASGVFERAQFKEWIKGTVEVNADD